MTRHATSPASGQGASIAFEDAVTLAKCLRDLPDVPAAFAAYEGLRRTMVMRLARPDERKLSWLHDHRIDWDTRITYPGVVLDGRR